MDPAATDGELDIRLAIKERKRYGFRTPAVPAAIATRRLRIPLMWTVLDKAGSSNQRERVALMRRYLALFGPPSIAWLLADREFIDGQWIEFLLKNNIMFAIRVKERIRVHIQDQSLRRRFNCT